MWKNSVARALIAGVCLGALLWPYEAGSAPRPYDDRRVQRKKQTTQRSARPQPKQEQPSSQIPNIPPAQKLGHFKRQILKASSSEITSEQKKILIEILDTLYSVPRGRWIIENAPTNLKFSVNQKDTSPFRGSYGGIEWGISLSGGIFKRIQKASPEERGKKIRAAVITLAHEMTHAVQDHHGLLEKLPRNLYERAIIGKLSELHAILEGTTVNKQMTYPLQHNWFHLLETEKKKDGASPQEAERFARTEFIKKHWQNNPKTPIQVNGNSILCPQDHTDLWNDAYNRITYENILQTKQKGTARKNIQQMMQEYIRLMDVSLKPDFFLSPETTAFRVLQNKFVGYMDGIKRQEIMAFEEGLFEKKYANGELLYVRLIPNNKKKTDGLKRYSFEDGYSTYTIQNGQMNGFYREHDSLGNQKFEIPIKNGNADGTGWQIKENGEKEITQFKNCRSVNYLRRKYQRSKERE